MAKHKIDLKFLFSATGMEKVISDAANVAEAVENKTLSARGMWRNVLTGIGLGGGMNLVQVALDAVKDHYRNAAEEAKLLEERTAMTLQHSKDLARVWHSRDQRAQDRGTDVKHAQENLGMDQRALWGVEKGTLWNPLNWMGRLAGTILSPEEYMALQRQITESQDKLGQAKTAAEMGNKADFYEKFDNDSANARASASMASLADQIEAAKNELLKLDNLIANPPGGMKIGEMEASALGVKRQAILQEIRDLETNQRKLSHASMDAELNAKPLQTKLDELNKRRKDLEARMVNGGTASQISEHIELKNTIRETENAIRELGKTQFEQGMAQLSVLGQEKALRERIANLAAEMASKGGGTPQQQKELDMLRKQRFDVIHNAIQGMFNPALQVGIGSRFTSIGLGDAVGAKAVGDPIEALKQRADLQILKIEETNRILSTLAGEAKPKPPL